MTRIFTAFSCIALTGLASGDNCRSRVLVQQDYQQAIVQAVPYAVAVPHYSVGYAAQDQSALEGRLKALEAKIDALLGQPGTQPGPLQKPAEQLPPPAKGTAGGNGGAPPQNGQVIGIFQAKCSACHDRQRIPKVKGDFAMLDGGKLLPWTVRQAGLVATLSYCQEMPPQQPLTDAEVGAIQQFCNAALKAAK